MMPTPDHLPTAVHAVEHARALDRAAIESFGIPGYELMCRAGRAAFDLIQAQWPEARRLHIYCGAGNNAGDGYVLGRFAAEQGFAVRILTVGAPEQLRGDAATAWRDAVAAGVDMSPFDAEASAQPPPDVAIDALLGIGLDRPLTGSFAAAVRAINAAGRPVLALDLPTGLHGDTGAVLGAAVRADVTLTFVALKQGAYLGAGPDYCGTLVFAGLGIPAEAAQGVEPTLRRLDFGTLARALPRRRRTAHKGDHGRVLLVGGGAGMGGAIRLAAEAALRIGAGLVYVATHPDNLDSVMSGRPEIMCHGVATGSDLAPLLELADAVVLGPGLGLGTWSRAIWAATLAADRPLVVDADALTLLSELGASHDQWALTPHPGEAARLLGTDNQQIQQRRLASVTELAQRFRAVTVLKGACSLIARADGGGPPAVCDRGNPGMATGGTGDVLAGVIGGLLAQTRDLDLSVHAGVLVHALAGDDAAADGERGMIASDLLVHIRRWANAV